MAIPRYDLAGWVMRQSGTQRTVPNSPFRSVAILNPLGDFGITTYSFELAEGLEANGVRADFYASDVSPLSELPARHRHQCFPVLGSLLLRQRRMLCTPRPADGWSASGGADDLPSAAAWTAEDAAVARRRGEGARRALLGLELALHLRRRRYDLVWTQWPDIYGTAFWRTCRALGLPLAHTVHNPVPHDSAGDEVAALRRVYAACDLLFVHSEQARGEFEALFPDLRDRVAVSRHGLYTTYPRCPAARAAGRRELGLAEGEAAVVICGGIRPYKNLDALVAALAAPRCARAVLVVAGEESGYGGAPAADPLDRTRRLAREAGVAERVRLIPRFLRARELAELLEAADVLALPYRKGYGSGLLLLGMSFGRHVLIADTGGAAEYVADYPAHTLLDGTGAPEVAAGLARAIDTVTAPAVRVPAPRSPDLEWPAIAARALTAVRERLPAR